MEQGISQSKTGNGWEIYSDFEVASFESPLVAASHHNAESETLHIPKCGVAP
jgi:hypothetical protein